MKKQKKQHDMCGKEINNPYNVLTSRVMRNLQELKGNLGSLEDPEKLLEAYVIQRNLATLVGTLLEIYEPLVKNVDLPVNLDQIEGVNEKYRNTLVKKLSGNKGISPLVLGTFSKKDYESHKRFMSACYDFTKQGKK